MLQRGKNELFGCKIYGGWRAAAMDTGSVGDMSDAVACFYIEGGWAVPKIEKSICGG